MKYDILIAPVNTEKAMSLMSQGVYAFWVLDSANKTSIKKEVEELFKVKVSDVNVIALPSKKRFFKGIAGTVVRRKKALVKVIDGSINFEKGF